jgi:hypothetical protein
MKTRAIPLLSVIVVCCALSVAQQENQPPTVNELLRILRIKTFRVRTPASSDEVWDLKVLPRGEVKPDSTKSRGLTTSTGLLSLRDTGNDV